MVIYLNYLKLQCCVYINLEDIRHVNHIYEYHLKDHCKVAVLLSELFYSLI